MDRRTQKISMLLSNQPNGISIGYSHNDSPNIPDTPFHYLSRQQQIRQISDMLESGVDWLDLSTELYLVSHKNTLDVWRDFGVFYLDE